ncbi:MAG: protein-glutamate methylesterase/protein-glutamine glutaminase [Planctomycetaceae bacterium]
MQKRSPDNLIRILVVDDSALYRQLIRNVLRDIPGVEVVGAAANGTEALEQLDRLSPDLFTLDVRMPGVDGIEVLRELKRRRCPTKAIMVSSLTASGAQVTTDALLEGAFDFILKPGGPDAEANRIALHAALVEKLEAFRARGGGLVSWRRPAAAIKPAPATGPDNLTRDVSAGAGCEAVVIGTSTGGPSALRQVLPNLPGDFPVPILVVQHMPPQYTHSLAQRLNEASEIEVVEACEGMTVEPGWAYIAPGGKHMKVVPRGARRVIQITDDPPERSCRPSADYLFRSAAEVFDGKVLAVVMTGMGRDGSEGCRELKRRGAFVIAQHPEGCDVYGMPKAVVEEQLADRQVPLEGIADFLIRWISTPRRTGN